MRQPHYLLRLFGIALFLTSAMLMVGCGPKTYSVEGQVVFEDDTPAKGLDGYQIMFQSEQHKNSAAGFIQADGTFTVGTFKDGDGAMTGTQKIAITPPMQEGDKPRPRSKILAKYEDFNTSELVTEIKAERNKVVVKVERKK